LFGSEFPSGSESVSASESVRFGVTFILLVNRVATPPQLCQHPHDLVEPVKAQMVVLDFDPDSDSDSDPDPDFTPPHPFDVAAILSNS
jgi:hypothetical protein